MNAGMMAVVAGLAGGGLFFGAAASGQVCPTTIGADLVAAGISGPTNYAGTAEIRSLSVGMDICNTGGAALPFNGGGGSTQRPVIASAMYRYVEAGGAGRFEQMGMGWAYYSPTPIQLARTCVCSAGTMQQLGAGCCSTDGAAFAGIQTNLGPRWEINASTGGVPAVHANPTISGSLARRLQFKTVDVVAGARYFVEVQGVGPGDSDRTNGFSFCEAFINPTQFNVSLTPTVPTAAAIEAWAQIDPGVTIVNADVAGDGRFVLAARATEMAGGRWDYEYALMNMSSHASARSFAVPLLSGADVAGAGFHDVDYHSGDGPGSVTVSGADWAVEIGGSAVAWSTQAFAVNPAANALRWGTVYNFRFTSASPPVTGAVVVGLFRSGGQIEIAGVPTPGPAVCACNVDSAAGVNSGDFFAYLDAYFAGDLDADFDGNGAVESTDFFAFVDCLLSPPAGC